LRSGEGSFDVLGDGLRLDSDLVFGVAGVGEAGLAQSQLAAAVAFDLRPR
jgi:hypothetical protein